MDFGANLKSIRKAAGLTQKEVAKRIGLSPQAVSRWENNYTEPDMATVADLCLTLGCTADDLTGHEASPLTREEREIVNMYRKASPEIRRVVRAVLLSSQEATN